jgi:hypothetical protein
MGATLRFLDTDETTVVTTVSLGRAISPGLSSNRKLFLHNNGDGPAEDIVISLATSNDSDGVDYALLAEDVGGIPQPFETTDLSVDSLPSGETYPFWTRATMVTGVTPDNNTREYSLSAAAFDTGSDIPSPIPSVNMLWDFNSDSITGLSDNTSMSAWVDDSGDPHNMQFPGTNGGTQPKYRDNVTDNINGHPVVHVTAGNQGDIPWPNFSPIVDDQSFTLYLVLRYNGVQAGHGIFIYSYEVDALRIYLSGSLVAANRVGYEYNVTGSDVDVDLAVATSGSQVQLLTFVFDKTGGTAILRRNGVQVGSSSNVGGTGAGRGFDWGDDFIEFFALAGGVFTCVGDYTRIIAYKVAHTGTTLTDVEGELMTTYGLP